MKEKNDDCLGCEHVLQRYPIVVGKLNDWLSDYPCSDCSRNCYIQLKSGNEVDHYKSDGTSYVWKGDKRFLSWEEVFEVSRREIEFEHPLKIEHNHCDWHGKCKRKAYKEVFPLKDKPESERFCPMDRWEFDDWSYLCRRHFYYAVLRAYIRRYILRRRTSLAWGDVCEDDEE
jgi:hypothetical protein